VADCTLYHIDPLRDGRWMDLVARHPRSSVFHTRAWLKALHGAYGYQPVAFTDAASGEALRSAVLFCRVHSWMTGRRLVSLPFSDHCEPLVDDPNQLETWLSALTTMLEAEKARYIELRPIASPMSAVGFVPTSTFCLHVVDLSPDLDAILARLHRSHLRRAIRKAERAGIEVEVGSIELLEQFYALQKLTRHRHGVPVQPLNWFRQLIACFGDNLRVWLAKHEGRAVGAIMTARHKTTLVYKYGCSDASFHRLGVMPLLFWRAIEFAKAHGLLELDLGRSDVDNPGLIAFKDHFGSPRRSLTYYRYSGRADVPSHHWPPVAAHVASALIPRAIQARVGGHFYKHFA
jgi:CelD/BcsL family acetyltransferase involved in cellulose biosynthesis